MWGWSRSPERRCDVVATRSLEERCCKCIPLEMTQGLVRVTFEWGWSGSPEIHPRVYGSQTFVSLDSRLESNDARQGAKVGRGSARGHVLAKCCLVRRRLQAGGGHAGVVECAGG